MDRQFRPWIHHAVILVALTQLTSAQAAESKNSSTANLTVTLPPPPAAAEKKSMSLKFKAGVSNYDWANKTEHTNQTAFGADIKAEFRFADGLAILAQPRVGYRSGYASSRFGEVTPKNGVSLGYGYIEAKPWSPITLQAGIIDQSQWGVGQVIEGPNPAAVEKIKIGEEYSAELCAAQVMASTTTGTPNDSSPGTAPGFFTESLKLSVEPKDAWLGVSAFGGHWAYQNLPAKGAGDNVDVQGNTFYEASPGVTKFKYEFEGWFAGGETTIKFSPKFKVGLHTVAAQNVRAPEGFRNAQSGGGDITVNVPHEIEIKTGVDAFFSESDIAPASYSGGDYFHNNRQGIAANLSLTFNKEKFKILSQWIDADTINRSPVQSRSQSLLLKLEMLYANIL